MPSFLKVIVQNAPGVVVHIDSSVEELGVPPKLGRWLLTKLPEGASNSSPLVGGTMALSLTGGWLAVLLSDIDSESDLDVSAVFDPVLVLAGIVEETAFRL
jgi:hypothetical protein